MCRRAVGAFCRVGCACLIFCAPAPAQVVQPTGSFPGHHGYQGHGYQGSGYQGNGYQGRGTAPSPSNTAPAPATITTSAPAAVTATAPAAAVPPSILDKPAQPAKVELAAGRLAIHADNSSLTAILHQVTSDSGMTVNGLGQDQRIFGSYGPGDPQEVLLALLDGSGYNVVMLGRTQAGTPKELSLSPRSAGGAQAGPSRPQAAQDDDSEDEYQPPQPPEAPVAPPMANPQPNGVRTPQQMLQELQQMRQMQLERQQQQQQQQQQPQ